MAREGSVPAQGEWDEVVEVVGEELLEESRNGRPVEEEVATGCVFVCPLRVRFHSDPGQVRCRLRSEFKCLVFVTRSSAEPQSPGSGDRSGLKEWFSRRFVTRIWCRFLVTCVIYKMSLVKTLNRPFGDVYIAGRDSIESGR